MFRRTDGKDDRSQREAVLLLMAIGRTGLSMIRFVLWLLQGGRDSW
jgi:hypothetical protein